MELRRLFARRGSLSLVAVPLAVGIVAAFVLIPRAVPPEDIPLPLPDARALAAARDEDRRLAADVRAHPLDDETRALGSALREFNAREARGDDEGRLGEARQAIQGLVPEVVGKRGIGALQRLRAVQLEGFLDEVRRFERTGQETEELHAFGGPFVARMTRVGWCAGHVIALDDDARRAAYKTTWSGLVGSPVELAPALDETRALYTFYLTHPHPSEAAKQGLETARAAARDPAALVSIAAGEQLAAEAWRLERIDRLGTLDHAYPLAFARGVSQYRLGQYEASARSFRTWLDQHPDGWMAVRARNHLLAAMKAADAVP